MQPNQPSITAENNAALRALEFMRPAEERICNDPYAKYFVSNALRHTDNLYSALFEQISGWDKVFPGVCDAILARAHFVDDCLNNAIEAGLQQVVILGAGYDTRALRFKRLKENATVFEVDHPATQEIKLKRFKQSGLTIPSNAVFVPIDFNVEDISPKLFNYGYRSSLRTFFIWEGITYYVSRSAIKRTLSFISCNAPEGSSVVFDYFPSSVVDGTSRLNEARALSVALKQLGEEFVFGLDPEKMQFFFKDRGFDLVKNITANDYMQQYLKKSIQHRRVSKMFIFAYARVVQHLDDQNISG